jgi:DNA polymerase-3 subunit epsilon
MRELWPAVQHLTSDATIVAYGAAFERRILIGELARWGAVVDRPQLCALRLARRLCPGRDSYTLTSIAHDLGLPMAGAHRATWDVTATAVVLYAMLTTHQHRPDLPAIIRACTLPAQVGDPTTI